MREKDRAVIERLGEIVKFVEGLGKGIAVVENGDCLGWEDAKRVRKITGAHSVMIARGGEANPTCFSDTPLVDLDKTLIPSYLRLAKYLDNHWSLTKFCIAQFKGDRVNVKKAESTKLRQALAQAKGYDTMTEFVGEWTGEDEMKQIIKAIEKNPPRLRRMYLPATNDSTMAEKDDTTASNASSSPPAKEEDSAYATPQNTQNPEPPTSGAPFLPKDYFQYDVPLPPPADPVTPTPSSI